MSWIGILNRLTKLELFTIIISVIPEEWQNNISTIRISKIWLKLFKKLIDNIGNNSTLYLVFHHILLELLQRVFVQEVACQRDILLNFVFSVQIGCFLVNLYGLLQSYLDLFSILLLRLLVTAAFSSLWSFTLEINDSLISKIWPILISNSIGTSLLVLNCCNISQS